AGVTTLTRQGYHLLTWTRADMIYWAVSDMDEAKLQTFAHLLQQQITESSKTECCYRQAA
ncbi:MAG TPA: hypothetical protein VFV38_30090, partial [Ktedonobacteraceae bacterium]|nr:hypothetical protein [Ktedonobacteraceae bacterium]